MNARDYAWRQLAAARLPGWPFDAKSFRPRNAAPPADPRDLDLAHALTRAVTKNLDHLRHLTQHYSGRTQTQIDPAVQIVLAIGLAQLRLFDRLPPYAVVDEAVNQTKRLGFGKAAGFVNAVLRRALREPSPPLPDARDAQAYAQFVLSHPPALFRRMADLLGTEDALRLAARHNAEPPLIVRGRPPDTAGVTVTPHELDGFFVVTGANEKLLSTWAAAGVAQAQDPTSAAVVDRMALAGARRILDRCCGVGTKTLQIAAAAPLADVVAIDPAAFRIEMLRRSLSSPPALEGGGRGEGFTATERPSTPDRPPFTPPPAPPSSGGERDHGLRVRAVVGTVVPPGEPPFDRILVDVPCSNSGVLIRRPEARYRQDDASLESLESLQRTILADTVPHLAPGGLLVYSTCSIWPRENEDQARWLADTFPELTIVDLKTTLPSLADEAERHHDGGFVAVLKWGTGFNP